MLLTNEARSANRRLIAVLAGGSATAVLILSGCSGGDTKVRGLRDDLRVIPAVREVSHTVTKTKTKKVCTSYKKGKCTSWVTRPDGVKTEKVIDRHGRSAVYCVELDNVNGKPTRDDRWYTVDAGTYWKAHGKDEGDKIKMHYLHEGCH